MTHPLYDRLGQFQRRLFEINHYANVAHWELGSGNVPLALAALHPITSELESLRRECRALIRMMRQDGGAL